MTEGIILASASPYRAALLRNAGIDFEAVPATVDERAVQNLLDESGVGPEDVAIVNEALEVFPGRIERDDWMGSARELHREVYGVEP